MDSAGTRLRAWRERQTPPILLADLALQLGISEGWLSLIERGATPGLFLALRIQERTGIHASGWPEKERKPRKRREAA